MHRILLSFMLVSFTGLLHSLPVDPGDPLDQVSLDANWSSVEGSDLIFDNSSPALDQSNMFGPVEPYANGLYDLSESISSLAEASSAGSTCTGESMETVNIARSLDSDQPFDIVDGEGFCLKDPQETQENQLKLPNPTDLYDLFKSDSEDKPLSINGMNGIYYCAAGDRVKLLCCEGGVNWDLSRDGCGPCESSSNQSSPVTYVCLEVS